MGVKEGVLDRKSNIYFFLQLQEECPQHTPASLDQQLSMHGRKGRKESDWLQGTCPGPQRKHSVMSSKMTFWCRYGGRNVCERQPGQTPRPNTENIPEELVTPGKSNYRTYLEFQTIFNFWQRKCLSLKEAKKKINQKKTSWFSSMKLSWCISKITKGKFRPGDWGVSKLLLNGRPWDIFIMKTHKYWWKKHTETLINKIWRENSNKTYSP